MVKNIRDSGLPTTLVLHVPCQGLVMNELDMALGALVVFNGIMGVDVVPEVLLDVELLLTHSTRV